MPDFATFTQERLKREARQRFDELSSIKARHGGTLEGVGGEDASRARQLLKEVNQISEHLPAEGKMRHPGPYGGGAKLGESVALAPGQSVADWARAKSLVPREQEGLSLAKTIRGFVLGDWTDAEPEKKGLLESVGAQGGVLVPTPLSSGLIDLVRNQARVFRAGATTVPMTSSTLKLARQTGDPTGVWHAEAAADIVASGPTFDSVTLTARTLICLVKLSIELLEDAIVAGGANNVVENAIAKALALELDSKALYGDGTANTPTGLRHQSGVNVQSMGGNGATPTNYDFLADAIFGEQLDNLPPNAMIDSPRTEQTLAKLKDTLGQPLRAPDAVNAVPRYSTKQVPTNLVQGTANNASDVFVGDWSQLLIGMRTQLQMRVLDQRYLADTGEIGIFAHLRADVQLAHPAAFTIIEGVLP